MAASAIYPSAFTPTFSPVEFHLSSCTFRADESIKISKYFVLVAHHSDLFRLSTALTDCLVSGACVGRFVRGAWVFRAAVA